MVWRRSLGVWRNSSGVWSSSLLSAPAYHSSQVRIWAQHLGGNLHKKLNIFNRSLYCIEQGWSSPYRKVSDFLVFFSLVLVFTASRFILICVSRSQIHGRTVSLRFLGIILRVLRLEVSSYNVYITNQFQTTFAQVGRGVKSISKGVCEYCSKEENSFVPIMFKNAASDKDEVHPRVDPHPRLNQLNNFILCVD